MQALAKRPVSKPRLVPLLLRASLAVVALAFASRANLAIVLYGWQNDWSPEVTFLAGLAPAAVVVAVACWTGWRDEADVSFELRSGRPR